MTTAPLGLNPLTARDVANAARAVSVHRRSMAPPGATRTTPSELSTTYPNPSASNASPLGIANPRAYTVGLG